LDADRKEPAAEADHKAAGEGALFVADGIEGGSTLDGSCSSGVDVSVKRLNKGGWDNRSKG
jgi:hypothetical protein